MGASGAGARSRGLWRPGAAGAIVCCQGGRASSRASREPRSAGSRHPARWSEYRAEWVTTADAFADYQQNEAWTWEHQALVRARVVYGDPGWARIFSRISRTSVCRVAPSRTVVRISRRMASNRARLRPSGAAGMLVTTADAFADYQQNEAWTWEHQRASREPRSAGSRHPARWSEYRAEWRQIAPAAPGRDAREDARPPWQQTCRSF
jgi:hypothetical protein